MHDTQPRDKIFQKVVKRMAQPLKIGHFAEKSGQTFPRGKNRREPQYLAAFGNLWQLLETSSNLLSSIIIKATISRGLRGKVERVFLEKSRFSKKNLKNSADVSADFR